MADSQRKLQAIFLRHELLNQGDLFDDLLDLIKEVEEAEFERGYEDARGEVLEAEAEAKEADARAEGVHDLLRELAEDRHKLGLDMAEEGWTGYGHTGTLRTCPDRLCSEAARLVR